MNKKLMIVMLVVGMSALYVRFQVVGMEEGDQVEQERQRLERERAAAEVPGQVEQDTEGLYGFLRPKNEADEEAEKKAFELNMRHENFPEEMRESVLSYVPLPPKVKAFLCHKVCIPNRVNTLQFGRVTSVAFSPDGKLLATGDVDRTAGIWDVASRQRLQTLQSGSGVLSVSFSSDGKLLATGSAGGTVGIWNVASGQRLQMLQHGNHVTSVSFSPDGRLLATGSEDRTAVIWDIVSWQRLQTLKHAASVKSVAFSPDGRLLATGSGVRTLLTWSDSLTADDVTARIWDVANGQRLQALQCDRTVNSVAFSPDGRLLATGNVDKKVDIWDVGTGQQLKTLQHDSWVTSVAFSPDGKWLATDAVSLWNVECFQTLERSIITTAAQYELMQAFELTLENEQNGTVRIVGKINATPEQWRAFETLPENMQKALRALIRNEREQEKAEDHLRRAAAVPAEQAATSGKEEE